MWTSVPQIDERRIRINTSNSPAAGTGISSSQSPGPRSFFTSACIVLIVKGDVVVEQVTSLGGIFSQARVAPKDALLHVSAHRRLVTQRSPRSDEVAKVT